MFNDRLRAVRLARGFTMQQVADAINVQLRSYQRYEGGHFEPALQTLAAIADFLSVPTDFLLERDEYLHSLGVSFDLPLAYPPRHPKQQSNR